MSQHRGRSAALASPRPRLGPCPRSLAGPARGDPPGYPGAGRKRRPWQVSLKRRNDPGSFAGTRASLTLACRPGTRHATNLKRQWPFTASFRRPRQGSGARRQRTWSNRRGTLAECLQRFQEKRQTGHAGSARRCPGQSLPGGPGKARGHAERGQQGRRGYPLDRPGVPVPSADGQRGQWAGRCAAAL